MRRAPEAVTTEPIRAAVEDVPFLDTEGALAALEATGMSAWEAIGTLASEVGPDAVKERWERFMAPGRMGVEILEALGHVARKAPEAANAWLNEALDSGRMSCWVDSARSIYGISMEGREWLTSLPEGLRVGGSLWLNGCRELAELPKGLKVEGVLMLGGCRKLKGLPEGLIVDRKLYCPKELAEVVERMLAEGRITLRGGIEMLS